MQPKHQFTEYAHCFLLSLSVLLPCLLVTAATDYAPRNQVVVAGRNVTLQCRSDNSDSLQWKYRQAVDGEKEISLISNQSMLGKSARFMLNTSIDGQNDLHILNVQRSDADFYICITTSNSTAGSGSMVTKRYEAQLAILSSDPNCTLNTNRSNSILVEKDYIRMQCYFRFLGDLVPVMNWRREGQLIDGAETNITKPHGTNQMTVMSSLLMQVNSTENGVRFSCDISFTTNVYNNSSDEYSIKATNNPDYKYTWTSPPINVSYGPQNLTIQFNNMSGDEANITLGDRLKCFADGNPIPRYEWTIFAQCSNLTLNSADFVLNASMLNNFQLTAECKAVNDFGEGTKIFSRNVTGAGDTCSTEQPKNQSNPSTIIPTVSDRAIVLMVLFMTGILSVLILLVIGRRRICKSNKGNSEDRVEIENGGPIYSVLGDHIVRSTSSSGIASVVLYQDGQVDTGNTDNCKVGFSPNYMEVIYEDINTHESDLVVNGGGYDDIMHYAGTELSKQNGDMLYTKGLNPNLTKQEQAKPKQSVGADGTIYTEVNKNGGSAELYSSVKKQSQSMKFPKSTYATIDHSVKTLPPPPKLL